MFSNKAMFRFPPDSSRQCMQAEAARLHGPSDPFAPPSPAIDRRSLWRFLPPRALGFVKYLARHWLPARVGRNALQPSTSGAPASPSQWPLHSGSLTPPASARVGCLAKRRGWVEVVVQHLVARNSSMIGALLRLVFEGHAGGLVIVCRGCAGMIYRPCWLVIAQCLM